MKKKLIRMVSDINIDNETKELTFKQALMGSYYFWFFGFCALFFMKKKKNICPINHIRLIEISEKKMSGRLIIIYTENIKYVLEIRNKTAWKDMLTKIPSLLPNVEMRKL